MRDSPNIVAPRAQIGDSPKRLVVREIATSPVASEHDKAWAKQVEDAITDHAMWIDKARHAYDGHTKEIADLRKALGAKTEAQSAPSTPAPDEQLRAHVQAGDLAVGNYEMK